MIRSPSTIWLTEVDSTNRFALENFDCFDSGTLIAASSQSAGRGSKGRSWCSPPDVNVYASLILKNFPCPVHLASRIGSLAVLHVLRTHAPGLPISVKWPNDVLCGRKKIAGILCETKNSGIVIGIGMNINMDRETAAGISRSATSLFIETGHLQPDVGVFADELRIEANALCRTLRDGGSRSIHEEWKSENFLLGKQASIRLPEGVIVHGTVVDFRTNGAILLKNGETGKTLEIHSGDLLGY